MQVIESASELEASILRLFVILLGGNETVAASVYLALDSAGPKTAAIAAVAKVVLNEKQQLVLTAIQKMERTNRKARDKFAHHTWAFSKDLPDAILLVDPRARINDTLSTSDIYVYRAADFKDAIEANNRLSSLTALFRYTLLPWVEMSERDLRFGQLLAEPEIASRLQSQA